MKFYDLVSESCNLEEGLERRLGFERILVSGRDITSRNVDDKKGAAEPVLAIGSDKSKLEEAIKRGASAAVISDLTIDRKLICIMANSKCALCLPMSMLTEQSGDRRARNAYKMSKLTAYARKAGVEVSIVSMAASQLYLCSSIQLIQLGRMIGIDETYGRYSLSSINKKLFGDVK